MSGFFEIVNRMIVSADLLGEALQTIAAMPAPRRSQNEARTAQLFELLEQKALAQDRAALAVAIDARVIALARLQSGDALRGWSAPGDRPGLTVISADLVKAAASEPLIEDADGWPGFDVERFRLRVLADAETLGRA